MQQIGQGAFLKPKYNNQSLKMYYCVLHWFYFAKKPERWVGCYAINMQMYWGKKMDHADEFALNI